MRKPSSLIGAAAAVVFAVEPGLSAGQTPGSQTPSFRSGTELVTVDVGVVDRQGQPMRGLNSEDFVVTVEGQPRRVVTAEFVDATPKGTNPLEAGAGPVSTNEGGGVGRQFVFVVDQNTLEPGSGRRVAEAAAGFFSQLTFADRSALMLMPTGTNLPFTWAHDRVRNALQRVAGLNSPMSTWEYGSLSEARDIANSNSIALRTVGDRECRGTGGISAATEGIPALPGAGTAAPSTPSATPASPTGGGGSATPAATGGTSNSSRSSRGSGGTSGFDPCRRGIQVEAESAWRSAEMLSQSSISSLRQMITALGRIPGDKTAILISGGWPLDDREMTSIVSTVAAEAIAARVTLFTLFVPRSSFTAARRMISTTPSMDYMLQTNPLEMLASMSGGGSYRAEVSADAAFDRMRRELAGYYRIGVERTTVDEDGKGRRMKIQVSRPSAVIRARSIFDSRTFEDSDWTARLHAALEAPVPATGVGLRVTSYLSTSPDEEGHVSIVLSGEASRLQPGAATFQLLVKDLNGKSIIEGEKPLGNATTDVLPFSASVPVTPGTYIVRMAVMDSQGHVGSVDHRVEARPTAIGPLAAIGPMLVRVPRDTNQEPRIALDAVRQDERLAIEIDIEGARDALARTDVTFEIAANAEGPALVRTTAGLTPGPRTGAMLAQAGADMRLLPPGSYIVRAKVGYGSDAKGELRRAFTVIEAPRSGADTSAAESTAARMAPSAPTRMPAGIVPRFSLEHAMSPTVLGAFLDRVAVRPDAASPAMQDLIARARTPEVGRVAVSDAYAAAVPVASFVKGLSLLAQHKIDAAADAFRGAMRTSADFYPAMVYIGVCYAAGGKDKEAAGAWRTALIKEGDNVALHLLLTDALLREGRGDLALQTVTAARTRWPGNDELDQRFVLAALTAGKPADGLRTLDDLLARQAQDTASLVLAAQVLYESFVNGRPIESAEQDRTRLIRLADVYRAQGGPAVAMIDTWVAAVNGKQ